MPCRLHVGMRQKGVVISVTEGDDMVRKHPLIFQISDFVVLNKIDLAEYMEVNIDKILEDLKKISPKKVFLTDAKHDKGIDEFVQWLIWKRE